MRQLIEKFFNDESGTTAIEYAIIAAGLSIVIVTVVNGIGSAVSTKLPTSARRSNSGRSAAASCKSCCLVPWLLTWGPPFLAFVRRHPWQVFAAVLVFVLLLDLMLSNRRSRGTGGDIGISIAEMEWRRGR